MYRKYVGFSGRGLCSCRHWKRQQGRDVPPPADALLRHNRTPHDDYNGSRAEHNAAVRGEMARLGAQQAPPPSAAPPRTQRRPSPRAPLRTRKRPPAAAGTSRRQPGRLRTPPGSLLRGGGRGLRLRGRRAGSRRTCGGEEAAASAELGHWILGCQKPTMRCWALFSGEPLQSSSGRNRWRGRGRGRGSVMGPAARGQECRGCTPGFRRVEEQGWDGGLQEREKGRGGVRTENQRRAASPAILQQLPPWRLVRHMRHLWQSYPAS